MEDKLVEEALTVEMLAVVGSVAMMTTAVVVAVETTVVVVADHSAVPQKVADSICSAKATETPIVE